MRIGGYLAAMLTVVLYIVATTLLACAAAGVPSRIGLGWLGLAVFVFTFGVLPHIHLG